MKLKNLTLSFFAALLLLSNSVFAKDYSTIALAVGGYDLVSYHQGNPKRGSGHQLAAYNGNTYAFSSAENKHKFESNPEQYLPQFGGYCAYGASLGKKFYGDPTVYEVVNGKLYLNLDSKIQGIWSKDKQKNIIAADELWSSIKYVPAAEL